MGYIVFSGFLFVFAHVVRAMIKASGSTAGSKSKSKSTSRASAWETVSKEWENARRERLSKNTPGGAVGAAEAAPVRSEPIQPGPDSPPALERIRAELEGGLPAGGPPPLPPALSLSGETHTASSSKDPAEELELIGLHQPESENVELHELGWRDGPEPRATASAAEAPEVEDLALEHRAQVEPLPTPPARKPKARQAAPVQPQAAAVPEPRGSGEPDLLRLLTEALEADAAAEPATEVRYSISSSLVRPAARLLSVVRTALGARGRAGDKALVEVARGLPMFGVQKLSGRHLESAALAEALDALRHASPALRSAVYTTAAQLAERLQPADGQRVVAALRVLADTEG